MSMTLDEVQVTREGFPRPTPDTPSNVMEQFRMDGRVVVVNGASSGIGLAVSEGFAEAKANVVMWYNSNDTAIQKAEEFSKTHSTKAKAYKVNVTDAEAVQKAIAQVVEDFGKLDVFVANAGTAESKPILEMSLESYREIMAVNVDGVVHCAKYAGEVFKRQGSGNLIITSSISGHIVNVPVDQPVYNASKAFVRHFGKSIAREWRDFARVNIVSPGFFDTKMGAAPKIQTEAFRMTPLGRQGHIKEIKGLYLYLASDASSFTTGTDVVIDGGYTLP